MRHGWFHIRNSGLTIFYRLLDAILIYSTLLLCLILFDQTASKDWVILGLIAVASFAFLAESLELYRSWRMESYVRVVAASSAAWIGVCIFLIAIGYFTKLGGEYSRLIVGSWFTLTLSILALWRALLRQLLFYLRAHNWNIRSAAIIGVTDAGIELAKNILQSPHLGIRIHGFYCVADTEEASHTELKDLGLTVLGDEGDAERAARSGELDTIYLALPMREEERIARLLDDLSDTTANVHLVPNLFVRNMLQGRWYQVKGSELLSVFDTPIEGLNSWLKRLEDLILGTLILTAVAPLMLMIAFLIRLTSPGPAIFKQRRYGLDGRVIDVWKFRTMKVMENGGRVVQACRNDARITPIGRILRRTSLDELPQFINVLQGSMSIVGPRPHAVAHNEHYRKQVSGYMLRHKVKPGITGWAQVNGWRGETDTLEKMKRRVEHDLEYIRNWSVFFDLRIVFLTIFKGFNAKNAY